MFGRTKKDGGRNLKYYKKSELVVATRIMASMKTVVVDGCVVKYGDFIVMKEFGTDFRTGWSKWNNWNGM